VTAHQAAPRAGPRPAAVDRRARFAVFWIFCLCGVIASLWSTSLPTINARLNLGETRLGLALLLTGAGAVAVMPLTGRLCDRLGSRPVLRAGRERADAAACQDGGRAPRDPAAPVIPPRHFVVLLLGLVASAGFIREGAACNWAPLHASRSSARPRRPPRWPIPCSPPRS
jgi:MFS family permease